jgi:sugar phosphate isomerase/epimerase
MMRLSISTWTLHGTLSSGVPLLELPALIAARGIHTLELCHFHLPSVEPDYLGQLRAALRDAGVELYSILIDRGDITSPDLQLQDEDLRVTRGWIDVAAEVGAQCVRIDAGLQPPTPEVVQLSAANLSELARYASERGVRVITENWHATSRYPRPLLEILDRCEGQVGLCADLGNAEGADKYETLGLLLPRATSIHFKVRYNEDAGIERTDFARCIGLITEAGFTGPISLIYNQTDREWAAVDQLKEALMEALPGVA